jgi:spore cortex formation protein SpoVR/YcgB (stage V sporulation)
VRDGVGLAPKSRDAVMDHLRRLWGYSVTLCGVDAASSEKIYEVSAAK